uniref:Acid phosphatase n=1 Tax=Aegilops tauschii subsp. strangulata TaxID=200361 RepID=A0A453BB05_AEGTS
LCPVVIFHPPASILSLALSSPLPDPAELLSIPSPSSPLSRRRILPASPSYSSRRPHSLQIQSKSPSSIAPFLPSLYTNLAAGPPLVLPAPERATHRVHRDCRGPAVRELEDGGGGQQPGAVGRRAAGLRAARARIPHWPRLPLRPRPRRGEASAYARAAAATGAWVFDVDETLLSNLPYYAQHGYGWVTHACHIPRSRACY